MGSIAWKEKDQAISAQQHPVWQQQTRMATQTLTQPAATDTIEDYQVLHDKNS
jgi:hypothetical protein